MGRRRTVSVAVATLGLVAACASDDSNPSTSPPDASAETSTPEPVDIGTGTQWSDLYRDIFGPTGRPGSCAFLSTCHGSADADGVKAGGVSCVDARGCRQSFLDLKLVKPENQSDPDKATLFLVIRNRDATGTVRGFMPRTPSSFVFPAKSIERMKAWIRDGAPDN